MFGIKNVIEAEELNELAHSLGTRLQTLVNELLQGKPMPAWGDTTSCSYCEMKLLCRKQVWENAAS